MMENYGDMMNGYMMAGVTEEEMMFMQKTGRKMQMQGHIKKEKKIYDCSSIAECLFYYK